MMAIDGSLNWICPCDYTSMVVAVGRGGADHPKWLLLKRSSFFSGVLASLNGPFCSPNHPFKDSVNLRSEISGVIFGP
jgi:hypothetical protein